jgi:hypothetical protein
MKALRSPDQVLKPRTLRVRRRPITVSHGKVVLFQEEGFSIRWADGPTPLDAVPALC